MKREIKVGDVLIATGISTDTTKDKGYMIRNIYPNHVEFWTDGWHEGYNKIKELRWVLTQFNQIKNK